MAKTQNDNNTNIGGDFVQGDKVGGDKIGRDKFVITNPTTYKYLSRKSVAIVLAVIALIALGTVLFSKLLPDRISLPTAAPFKPAVEGEALIIVLPFHVTASGSSDAHTLIRDAIEERRQELGLDYVRVEIDPRTVLELAEREAAQALGERYDAAVVIWGTESRTSVKVNFLNIKEPEISGGNEQVQVIAPDTLVGAEFIEGHLPGQLTFLSLFAIGQAIVAEGKLALAIPIIEAAVDNISEEMIVEELASPEVAADAYFRLGWLYNTPPTHEFRRAAEAYEQSLVFNPMEIASLVNLGVVYKSLGEYETAIDYMQQSLTIAQTIGNKAGEGKTLGNLGSIYRYFGEYETAIDYMQQSLAIAQEIGDKQSEGIQLGNLGLVYYSLGEYETAINYHEQALAIAQTISDKNGIASDLGNLGLVYYSLGKYETAIDYIQQSLTITQEIGDKQSEEIQLGNLGLIHEALGEYKKAISYHEQSLVITQEIGDKQSEGANLSNLGSVYRSLGEYETAVSYYEQALSIAQAISDKPGEGITLGALGLVYYDMGMYETAASYTQQALAIFEEIGAPHHTAHAQQQLDILNTVIN